MEGELGRHDVETLGQVEAGRHDEETLAVDPSVAEAGVARLEMTLIGLADQEIVGHVTCAPRRP